MGEGRGGKRGQGEGGGGGGLCWSPRSSSLGTGSSWEASACA